jgi:hypothetical protein
MKTKFHHYIFPAVPPAALLTGIFLDDALGERPLVDRGRALLWLATTTIGVALSVYGFARLLPGPFWGSFDSKYPPQGAAPLTGVVVGIAGLVLTFVSMRLARDPEAPPLDENEPNGDESSTRGVMIGAAAVAGAVAVGLVARDLASVPGLDIKGQERLIQLFTYRYDRVWPRDLLFAPALLGFGLTATALTFAVASRGLRRQAIVALAALAFLFTAWDLDVYMMKVAPHWGQRPLFDAYYRDRRSPQEPIVAFEMNWKGENFYSGGRLIEFGNGMSQGGTAGERASDRMRTWLGDMRKKVKAIYFVTEAGRVAKIDEMLKSTLGTPPNGTKWTEQITTEQQDNKFVVVRARFE